MTSPRLAEATAKGRYYRWPAGHPMADKPYPISVTNVLSVGCAKPALVPWAAKIAAEYAVDNLPSLVARTRTTDRETLRKEISDTVTVARDKASDLGSRIHHLAEAHVLGKPVAYEDGDEVAEPFVAQYMRFLKDFDVDINRDVESTELTVAHPALGYAGTLDLLIRLKLDGFVSGQVVRPSPQGERSLWLVDLKSSSTRPGPSVYGEYALQLAALRHATEMWLPGDQVEPMVRGITGSAVLNLRSRTYELVPLPTGGPEFTAFQGSLALAKWMHSTGHDITGGEFRPITPTGRVKPKNGRTKRSA